LTIGDGTCYARAARWHDQLVRMAALAFAAGALAACGGAARATVAGATRCGGATGVACSAGQVCARDPAVPCPTGIDCAGVCADAPDLAAADLAAGDGLPAFAACTENRACASGVCCFSWTGVGPSCSDDCPPATAGPLCSDSRDCLLSTQACCPTGLTGVSACAPGYVPGCRKFCDTDADCPGARCLTGSCEQG